MILPKTYLTEAVDKKAILRILTQGTSVDANDPRLIALADWAGRRQSKIKNIELSNINISNRGLVGNKLNNRYNTLGSLLNTIKNLMDQQGANTELAKAIQQITLEILEDLKAKEEGRQPEEETGLYEGMDWTAEKAKRLTAARETGEAVSSVLDKFYNDYYSIEYAGKTKSSEGDTSIVTKLKSLDKILIPEFTALGYNPEVNPLAQFLKILIELRAKDKSDNIFDRLNTNNYGAIHNSFKDKRITGNMLGNYSTTNILFCKDLYNYKGLDIVSYLSLWKDAFDKAEGDNKTKEIIAAKVIISQPNVVGATFADKVDSLKSLQENSIVVPTSNSAKLRSTTEIRELLNYLFGPEPDESTEAEDIIKKTIASNVVLEMIRYLAKQAKLDDNHKKAVANWLKEAGYEHEADHTSTCIQILLDYDIKPATAWSVILKLTKHYNTVIRKKEASK